MKKNLLYIGSAVLVVVVGLFVYKAFAKKEQVISFETAKVEKGTISNTATATGTLEAIKTVEVGTQVSGVITKIYVDFNSQVKKGQLLAQLDETPLIAQLDQAKSTVDQADAQLKYQKATYERYKVLIGKKLIAQSDFDLAEYNYNNALAALANAKTGYDRSKINLSYARIYSPIDGIIIERAVDEGQTVAASFSTPTLFTIANDLTQMRVEAKVDEADIGKVLDGQRVEFSVDAFPSKKFAGKVTEIRLKPVTTNNVVTYTVVIGAPNPEYILKPGMTASATFFVNEKKDILLVSAKATRFTPDLEALAASNPQMGSERLSGPKPPMPPMVGSDMQTQGTDNNSTHTVWIKESNGSIHPQRVTVGVTDEINFEVINGLNEGQDVVTSMNSTNTKAKKPSGPSSLFKAPGSGRRTSTTNPNQGPPQ